MAIRRNIWPPAIVLVPALVLSGALNAAPNILLLIGDDMGVETLASYGVGENPPTTAALDELADQGVRFTNFWSQPICSPTRATMLTGRYGFRTGIGRPTSLGPHLPDPPAKPEWAPYERPITVRGGNAAPLYLLPEEFSLPMAFKANADPGYATAAIGKWHLADVPNGWIDHPNLVGFDHFSGLITGKPLHFSVGSRLLTARSRERPVIRRSTRRTTLSAGSRRGATIHGFCGSHSIFRMCHCICRPKKPGNRITRTWTPNPCQTIC